MRLSTVAALRAALVLSAAVAGTGVAAQASSQDHFAALRACQNQTDPAARLACYDTAVKDIVSAADTGSLPNSRVMARTVSPATSATVPRHPA